VATTPEPFGTGSNERTGQHPFPFGRNWRRIRSGWWTWINVRISMSRLLTTARAGCVTWRGPSAFSVSSCLRGRQRSFS